MNLSVEEPLIQRHRSADDDLAPVSSSPGNHDEPQQSSQQSKGQREESRGSDGKESDHEQEGQEGHVDRAIRTAEDYDRLMSAHPEAVRVEATMDGVEDTTVENPLTPKEAGIRFAIAAATAVLAIMIVVMWAVLWLAKPLPATTFSFSQYAPETSLCDVGVAQVGLLLLALPLAVGSPRSTVTPSQLQLAAPIIAFNVAVLELVVVCSKAWVFSWGSEGLEGTTAVMAVATIATVAFVPLTSVIDFVDRPFEMLVSPRMLLQILRPFVWPGCFIGRISSLAMWATVLGTKVAELFAPLYLAAAVTQLVKHNDFEAAGVQLLYFGLLSVVPACLVEVQDIMQHIVYGRAMYVVGRDSFLHIHNLDVEWHLQKSLGDSVKALDCGLRAAKELIRWGLLSTAPMLLAAIAAFIVFQQHLEQPRIAAVAFLCMSLYVWVTFFVTMRRRGVYQDVSEKDVEATVTATDALVNFETVKLFANEEMEANKYADAIKEQQEAVVKKRATVTALNIAQNIIVWSGKVVVLLLAAHAVTNRSNNFDEGRFVAVLQYMTSIFAPLTFLGDLYDAIVSSLVDMHDLAEVLTLKPTVQDAPNAVGLPPPRDEIAGHDVEFKNVSFSYPTAAPGSGLHDVSFSVRRGTTTAVVGPSGSGKSTLWRLLFRLYDVDAGAVLVSGSDVRSVCQHSLRTAIGIVPQDTQLFNNTLHYNVRYGRTGASKRDVMLSAFKSRLCFMANLPRGWSTMIGARGLKLSGGERQRVSIARCVLKDPSVVVLDEATSALDTMSEREVHGALMELQGRTTLVIAHRLTTVLHADQIVVLDAGRVAAVGRHEDLLDPAVCPSTVYRDLWNAQLSRDRM